jgi:hypothetical protein
MDKASQNWMISTTLAYPWTKTRTKIEVNILALLNQRIFLLNLTKVKLTVILWGGNTLGGSATRMRKKIKMCVSLILREHHHAQMFLQPDRKKSKAEVMAEVIAKSKEHKVIY